MFGLLGNISTNLFLKALSIFHLTTVVCTDFEVMNFKDSGDSPSDNRVISAPTTPLEQGARGSFALVNVK